MPIEKTKGKYIKHIHKETDLDTALQVKLASGEVAGTFTTAFPTRGAGIADSKVYEFVGTNATIPTGGSGETYYNGDKSYWNGTVWLRIPFQSLANYYTKAITDAQAIELLTLHNSELVFSGFVDTTTATPSNTLNKAYIATVSGTIFGVSNVVKGQIIKDNGTSFLIENIKKTVYDEFLFDNNYQQLVTSISSGLYTNSTTPSASTTLSCTNLINVIPGQNVVIKGLGNSKNIGYFGVCFKSDNSKNNEFRLNLSTDLGGDILRYTIPLYTAKIGLHAYNADINNVIIQIGSEFVKKNEAERFIKESLLPETILDLIPITTALDQRVQDLETNSLLENEIIQILPIADNIALPLIPGYYYNSNITTSSNILTTAASPINSIKDDSFAIKGITSLTGLSFIGQLCDSSGNKLYEIKPSDLVIIDGGYKYTVGNYPTATQVGFHFLTAGINNLSIQKSDYIQDAISNKRIKTNLLTDIVPTAIELETLETKINSNELLITAQNKIDSNLLLFNRGNSDKNYENKKNGYIIFGQSNALGRTPALDLPAWFIANGNTIPNAKFCENDAGTFSNFTETGQWSFEVEMYKLLVDYLNDEIYSIKMAEGGSSITELYTAASGHWTPYLENIPSGKHPLMAWLEKRIRLATNTSGSLFDIKCAIMHQGESEAAAYGDIYYDILKNVIYYLRGICNNQRLPIILGGINTSSTGYSSLVEGAKLQLASEDIDIYYAPVTNGAGYLFDGVHFSASGNLDLANSVFNIIKDF